MMFGRTVYMKSNYGGWSYITQAVSFPFFSLQTLIFMTKSWLCLPSDWQKVFGWVYLPSNNEEVRTNFKLPRLKNKLIICAHMAREVEGFQLKNWTFSYTYELYYYRRQSNDRNLVDIGMKEFLDKPILLVGGMRA